MDIVRDFFNEVFVSVPWKIKNFSDGDIPCSLQLLGVGAEKIPNRGSGEMTVIDSDCIFDTQLRMLPTPAAGRDGEQ